MGLTTAMGYAETVTDRRSLERAIHAHLTGNCFPPIPATCVAAAADAVEACSEGDHDRHVMLPEGVRHRIYGDRCPALETVNGWRLEAFVTWEES